jgi:hypothetical protein
LHPYAKEDIIQEEKGDTRGGDFFLVLIPGLVAEREQDSDEQIAAALTKRLGSAAEKQEV